MIRVKKLRDYRIFHNGARFGEKVCLFFFSRLFYSTTNMLNRRGDPGGRKGGGGGLRPDIDMRAMLILYFGCGLEDFHG
jgi:hypothetical protein